MIQTNGSNRRIDVAVVQLQILPVFLPVRIFADVFGRWAVAANGGPSYAR
jgi:hypothetical protein